MSSAIVDKKFLPKRTKSCVGVGLYASHDTDEIGADISNLEREMRSLHNRLAQIECNTDQKLAALGQRLHTLNKTIDNLNTKNETPSIPTNPNPSMDTSVNCRPCFTSTPNPSMDTSVNCRPCFTSTPNYNNSTPTNKPKWSSPLVYDRPRAGDDTEHRRPQVKFSSILSVASNYGGEIGEAARLRTELNLREQNLAVQERELTIRKNQLLTRIKSLTSQSWSEKTLPKLENTAKSRSSFGENRSQIQWKDDPRSPQTQTVF